MKIPKMPVMQKSCPTCPFGPHGDRDIRQKVELRCMTEASQICHHPRLQGHKETHFCRGARDHQLTLFYRMGFCLRRRTKPGKPKCRNCIFELDCVRFFEALTAMRVLCSITETEVENGEGREVPGILVECTRCGHTTECMGTGDSSRKRAMAKLRETCPEGEENFYVDEADE